MSMTNVCLLITAISAMAISNSKDNDEDIEDVYVSTSVHVDGSTEPYFDGRTVRRLVNSPRLNGPHVRGSYEQDPVEEICKLAYVSYCDKSAILDWSCEWCTESDVGTYTDITVLSQVWEQHEGMYSDGMTKSTTNTAFVAYSEAYDQIVVSFSVEPLTSLAHHDSELVDYPGTGIAGAMVHSAFYAFWTGIDWRGPYNGQAGHHKGFREEIMPAITAKVEKYPNANVVITGHGLGAAVSKFAMLEIAPLISEWWRKVISYTFGEPMWCNKEMKEYFEQHFAVWYDNKLDRRKVGVNFRVYWESDEVAQQPNVWMLIQETTWAQYVHVNQGIFLSGGQVKKCIAGAEDPNCQQKGTDISDHYKYYNLSAPYGHAISDNHVCESRLE